MSKRDYRYFIAGFVLGGINAALFWYGDGKQAVIGALAGGITWLLLEIGMYLIGHVRVSWSAEAKHGR